MSHVEHPESPRFGPLALALGLAGVFFAVGYPWAIDVALERLGTRATAVGLLAIAALTLLPARRADSGRLPADGRRMERSRIASLCLIATLVGAMLLDDRRLLRLLPAWVYFEMSLFCYENARSEQSIIEQAVRWAIPEAPDFIRDYCRVLTGLWGGFFLLTAVSIAVFAVWMPPEHWRLLLSRDIWFAMAGLMAIEFFVRKTWFRYYFRNGPFERFWARLFPAEATARGRRSMEYIAAYHARIARERPSAGEESHG